MLHRRENRNTDVLELLKREYNVTPPRYQIHWAADALKTPPKIDWIVDKLFAVGSVNLIVGEGGSKKTYLALDLAVCTAMGKPWLGFSTKQSPVLIIDEEIGRLRMWHRLYKTQRGHQVGQGNTALPLAWVSLARFDLQTKLDNFEICDLLKTTKAKLVIFDALVDIMPGGDENTAKDVQVVFSSLRTIANDYETAIVVIHHVNKKGGYRGSTALKGAVDLMLMVESSPKSKNIVFSTEKSRDIAPPRFSARANFVDDKFWLSASSAHHCTRLTPCQEQIIHHLRNRKPTKTSDIQSVVASETDYSPATIRQGLYALKNKTMVSRTNPGGKRSEAEWALTVPGQNYLNSLDSEAKDQARGS